MRPSNRKANELRPISFQRQFTRYAEGSVLSCFGDTQVLCNASVTEGVPKFLRDSNRGWLTAEYSMLPRATTERTQREVTRGRQNGRTMEIQRLIGRSLRTAIDLTALGPYTIVVDCDVLQADGGTRTAAISGAMVAVIDALRYLQRRKRIKTDPLKHFVAAVSVGIYQDTPILDLDYAEDSKAETDMNVVMTDGGGFIEIQGTAEGKALLPSELLQLTELAQHGINSIHEQQRLALAT